MRDKTNSHHNLPDLFKSIFDLYIPRNLSHGASNLLFTLLYKFNQVPDKETGIFFPKILSIYNFELSKMLGINEKTLIKLRTELTNFRLIVNNENSWVVKYESGGTREAGFYQLNFDFLENINSSNLSEYYSQDRDQLENNVIPESQDIGNNIDAINTPKLKNHSLYSIQVENNIPDSPLKKSDDKPAQNKDKVENGKFLAFKQNKTKQNKTSSNCSSVDPVQVDFVENSKESEDDFGKNSRNPEEPDQAVLDNINWFIDHECQKKWAGEPHSKKYPDNAYRKKIALMYKSGTRSFVHKTIQGKIQETRVEENLDKFVLESLERSIKENESYYEK